VALGVLLDMENGCFQVVAKASDLGEGLTGSQEVGGSSPPGSTIFL